MSSIRKPTIKHKYPNKSKTRISISRLICHLLLVLDLQPKTVFPSIAFSVISSPVKIPGKKSLRSVHYDTSGGNPLAKRKQHTRELPGKPRLNISFHSFAMLLVQNINAWARKRQVFYFLLIPALISVPEQILQLDQKPHSKMSSRTPEFIRQISLLQKSSFSKKMALH